MSSVVRTTTGTTMIASAIAPAQPEKWPIWMTTASYTKRPMMIDGALNRMSLTKRTASPNRLPRAYSARKVPARMPVGVPASVAIAVIRTLPKIALRRPPLLPGGGVIWVNKAGPSAPMPFVSRVHSTRTSHNRPSAVAAVDSAMTTPFTTRRRA